MNEHRVWNFLDLGASALGFPRQVRGWEGRSARSRSPEIGHGRGFRGRRVASRRKAVPGSDDLE